MAKASINSGGAVEPVHTRTTAGTEESQVAVIGVDGSDNVVGTPAPADAKPNPTNALDVSAHGLMWNGTTWDRVTGTTANGVDVDVTRLPALPAGTNNIGDVDVLTLPSLPAGAAIIGKVDINSAPQVAVNNVETLTDNAAFTDGTSKLFPQGYIFDESAGTALTENDVAAGRVDSKRAVVNVLEDASTRGRRAVVSATGGLLGDQGVPAAQTNAWFVKPRKLATYRAVFGPAIGTRPNWLANAFGAAGRKQYATIHHAAAATKTVRLRRVRVGLMENTVAALVLADLMRITAAPATGNPVVTPGILDNADSAAEATCLSLPTTAGTEGALISRAGWDAGVIAGASTTAQGAFVTWQDLLPPGNYDDESKAPVVRAGVLEGWAVTVDVNAATNPKMLVEIEFTEE